MPRTVTVEFQGGRSGLLDTGLHRTQIWVRRIDRQRQRGLPVYVEVDAETNAVTELLIPEIGRIFDLTPDAQVDIDVVLGPSAAPHRLFRTNPDFEALRALAEAARDEGFQVLVTTARRSREVLDIRKHERPSPPAPGPSPGPPPSPGEGPGPVTEQRAADLFQQMNGLSCDCSVVAPCIPFKYPTNGCWARAHEMCRLMMEAGEQPEKIWIYASSDDNLNPSAPNDPDCEVSWRYHVAPTLLVSTSTGTEKRVIDPSLCSDPVSPDYWRDLQEHAATLEYSDASVYYKSKGSNGDMFDADYSATRDDLQDMRDNLAEQCDLYGPPPYSCPIAKGCVFIVDRSTFGEDEIAARLQQATPAVIDAAFYVVVDGFTPVELGINAATVLDPPAVVPTLGVLPNIPSMTVTPTRLSMDFPQYPQRRQRMTWTYRIAFANTNAFVNETPVTLTATISTVSASATIYLIKQPNPYEIDGPVSWLSTDLRVFQIKAGESRFGVTMSSAPGDAPTFIQEVLHNLNHNTTNGQTFEADISTDQDTAKLELAESVGGTRVFNFTVARVRYRALVQQAQNVRVFFRLFPASTTSLAYDQATTYRRGGQGGVIIPRLGVINDDVVTIPCFAEPRIDSSATSMDTQTDPKNVQTMQPDGSGAEVSVYFGCWLDINQPGQPQYPFTVQPNNDGPFPVADRKSIYQHVRNRHQCLVAEIAFDPDPIPTSAAPGSSDKLAQRNLAIYESANPGDKASHRIPNTFEIRRARDTLGSPDELMIDWGNVPAGSVATLYMPGASMSQITAVALQRYRSHRFAILDEHTLRWPAGGITYAPMPSASARTPLLPGLLTIDLPPTVKKGQAFSVVVRQVTDAIPGIPLATTKRTPSTTAEAVARPPRWRRIVGSFQVTMPVRTKEEMLAPEERLLANVRWIQQSIPADNRWFPVFGRYIEQIAARVDALGGDSTSIAPSPSGDGAIEGTCYCSLLAWLSAAFLALFMVALGALGPVIAAAAFALLAGTGGWWLAKCRPPLCRLLKVVIAGVGLGIGALIVAVTVGMPATNVIAIGLAGATAIVVSVVLGRKWNCW